MSFATAQRTSLVGRLLARRGRPGDPAGGPGRRVRLRRVLIGLVVLVILLGGGWLWFRSSSLVAVRTVTVTGLTGRNAARIRRELIVEAHTMSTLDVNLQGLHDVVAPYPEVLGLHVSTSFPHAMRIVAVEQYPVAVIASGGTEIEVASDGTLLNSARTDDLPRIPLSVPPGGLRVTERPALDAISVLVAAPYQFLSHITEASENPQHGVVIQLRAGPAVYFGSTSQLAAKWHSLIAVLNDPGSAGATYIDVSDPSRPAAGAGTEAVQAAIADGLSNDGTTPTTTPVVTSVTPAPTMTGTTTYAPVSPSTDAATSTTPVYAPTSTGETSTETATSTAPTGGAAAG